MLRLPTQFDLAVFVAALLATTVVASGVLRPSVAAHSTAANPPTARAITDDDPPLPEYISGDECLFCHRFQTGETWPENRHNRTVRRPDDDEKSMLRLREHKDLAPFADETQFVMGNKRRTRFLRKGQGYGRLDLLSAEVAWDRADAATVVHADRPSWDTQRFGQACAGCHSTQADSRTQSFSAISLDCFVCHGNSTLEHTKDKKRMLFARGNSAPARTVVSACGQCHLRGGRSKATGLPYPNNFTAGEDLFADFVVNLAAADDATLNPGDRHVVVNVRSVLQKDDAMTCISCHNVHAQTTVKHRRLPRSAICYECHDRDAARWSRPTYEVHSDVCGY
jgi:predicted CXXCH cytochrome family protein